MCQTYEGSYIDPSLRNDCDFIPFTEDELKEIADSDRGVGRQWNPPLLTSPTLVEMCERVRRTDIVE